MHHNCHKHFYVSCISVLRSYDAIIGVTSNDWFHQQSAQSLEVGIREEEKDMLMKSYIINNYETHLREIFLATANEYSEWDQVSDSLYSRTGDEVMHNSWAVVRTNFQLP